jgi:class 3 adenylate cyclase
MFCDLVGSTELSEALDPEEAREFVHAYQELCTEIIERHGGFIARFIGDGLLIYFGYPQAHEDDAARAVRAGLEVVDAVAGMRAPRSGATPAVRVGIDTGEVVIGEMAAGRHRQAMEIVGRAPNVAARLQSLAEPGTVLITDVTRRLVEGYVVLEDKGDWNLRGLARPVRVFRVVRTTRAEARFDVAAGRGLTPLVGRTAELAQLVACWDRVAAGDGGVVLITGEAGIGKTRLVHELLAREVPPDLVVVDLRCSPDHQTTPLYPVARELGRALERRGGGALAALQAALAAAAVEDDDAVPLLADALSLRDVPPAPDANLLPHRRLTRTLSLMYQWLVGVGRDRKMVIVVENLHWADPTTLELMQLLAERPPAPGVLVLLTARTEFVPPWRPASPVVTITLRRLATDDVSSMIDALVEERTLSTDLARAVIERADGVPLFVEELTRAVVEGDDDQQPAAVPASLHDSLLARLDRLGRGRDLVGVASVIGREFTVGALQRISGLDDHALDPWLTMLCAAGVLVPVADHDERAYRFTHALLRDAAYSALLLADRRRLHRAAADDVLAHDPERADTDPELLARHYSDAGALTDAIRFWRRASRRAEQHGSMVEAASALDQALAALDQLPETPERDADELRMRIRLGFLLYSGLGGSDERIGAIFERSAELATRAGDAGNRMIALSLAAAHFHDRGDHHRNLGITSELIELAETTNDDFWMMTAYACAATPRLELGRVTEAEGLLTRALALLRPEWHQASGSAVDPAMNAKTEYAWVLWHRGRPDAALTGLEVMRAALPRSALIYAEAHLAVVMAVLHFLRHEPEAAGRHALVADELAREHRLDQVGCHAQFVLGWELATRGDAAAGIEMITAAVDRHAALDLHNGRERGLVMLALACRMAGKDADARAALHEGQARVRETGSRRESPDLWRIEAELVAADGDRAEAIALAKEAVRMAMESESLSYELRARMTLSRLDPSERALAELERVYRQFGDGFTTVDLVDAAALLGAAGAVS